MLHLLDESLETFLRAVVPLPAREVDIAFDAPDGDWAARCLPPDGQPLPLGRPAEPGRARLRRGDRRARRRPPRPPRPAAPGRLPLPGHRLDQRGARRALAARRRAVRAAAAPGDRGRAPARGRSPAVRPLPTVRLRSGDGSENSDFWSALGGQLKPGLDLVVTVTVDAAAVREAGPPVRELQLQQRTRDGSVIDEPLIIADEQHTTAEQGPPREPAADGPIELAARMGRRSPEGLLLVDARRGRGVVPSRSE